MIVVRKNIVTFTASFAAEDGSSTQPSAANAVLAFQDQTGTTQSATIPLTLVTVTTTDPTTGIVTVTNTWTGQWDSSAAGGCEVQWMVWGYGTLQAATEGCFVVEANAANTV